MRYFIELAYNGTPFHGWQRQPNAITVQERLENALTLLLREKVIVTGAGRTDAGVHAKWMVAHFDSEIVSDTQRLIYKLNSFLPSEIVVYAIREVTDDAHARFDAISRSYEYKVNLLKDPFSLQGSYYIKKDLNINSMKEAAALLLEYENFKCFSKSNSDVKTYHCNITEACWQENRSNLVFKISANRFLRNMVRAIVGTLLEIGTSKLKVSDMKKIIESEDRSQAGYSVPAHGLYLVAIEYPEKIYR